VAALIDDDDDDERWWRLLREVFPSTERLQAQLRGLERDDLLDFAGFVAECTSAVREPWQGPFIDDAVGHLSEDSTQDLADWIVTQGKSYWSDAVGANDEHLRACFELSHAVLEPGHPRAWQPTPVLHLTGTVHHVWSERFDPDDLYSFLAGLG
jgi:hypothetical protein